MPAISTLTIHGYRGFGESQTLNFAIPNDNIPGSGYTVIVGPNNGGKSSITEALRVCSHSHEVSFTETRRNKVAGDRVEITVTVDTGDQVKIKSVPTGGSETVKEPNNPRDILPPCFSLPSRRFFNPFFGKSVATRESYSSTAAPINQRSIAIDEFSGRLFKILQNIQPFNEVLKKVLNYVPKWTIEQSDQGQHYLKFSVGDHYHTSDGMGEGIVSLMFIIDALYDSSEGDAIIIDEPELSLHPSLQRNLSKLFREYSATRQIICATHSPYFIDFHALCAGGKVSRIHKRDVNINISPLSSDSIQFICSSISNLNNPHIFGLDAREVFFLEENVILVEGQEDVLVYEKICKQLNIEIIGEIFGWGVGGADNMENIAKILCELGFTKVIGILDGNMEDKRRELAEKFPDYEFYTISANNIRTKPARIATEEVIGLTDTNGNLLPENEQEIRTLFEQINGYFQ